IDAPLLVALIVPDRKARLLLVSSQASPPSSIVSFHSGTANLTDSSVSLLSSTTVLPSASTSLPPHDHRYGYQKAGASPKVWPRVLTERLALCLQLLAGSDILLPVGGEVLGVVADIRPPRFAVGEQHTENCERDSDPS